MTVLNRGGVLAPELIGSPRIDEHLTTSGALRSFAAVRLTLQRAESR